MREESVQAGSEEQLRSLPVNLLLKGRLCLLVGAGHVAHRKCRTLLEHGARVVLVAPEVSGPLRSLESEGRVAVRTGRYEPGLLAELRPFLVYAATDEDETNRRIVRDAADLGILASSVSSWREGDFISPSRIPRGKGQVSVSTEGASCRQAKFMRLRLSELLGGDRRLVLIGADLRSLELSELETIRPDAEATERLTSMLRHLAALEEFVLLATCNRLELYAWTRPDEGLLALVRQTLGLDRFSDRVYVETDDVVIEHAANVVAGHYSQVTCETQITGQCKAAFKRAFDLNVAGVNMPNLFDRALTLSKKLRALQGPGERGLPALVASVVRKRLPSAGPRVLLLGAGGLGCEIASKLSTLPGIRLAWGNRTVSRIPGEPACERLALGDALDRLRAFDQVISVLGSSKPVIREEHLARGARAPFLIDLGLPRNVDPDLAARGDVDVLTLGDFRGASVARERLTELAHAVAAGSGACDV